MASNMIAEILATIVEAVTKVLSIILITFKVWVLTLSGYHQLLITETVDITDIGEEIFINSTKILDLNKISKILLALAMPEVFGLWLMLLVIIWVILIKTLALIIHSIKNSIIMIFVQFLMLILQITTKTESKTVDWPTLPI
jgi:hypothetical protein